MISNDVPMTAAEIEERLGVARERHENIVESMINSVWKHTMDVVGERATELLMEGE